MKRIVLGSLIVFLLTSCNGWFFQPSPYNPPTPFLPPTRTPSIVTATSSVAGPSSPTPNVATSTATVDTPAVVFTSTPFAPITDTPPVTITDTVSVPAPAVSVEVLGCNTSIDLTHAMGEVTNAYIILTNTGNTDLTNIRATLFALDEGREHPDKTVEIPLLPIAQKVTTKLTVDSTYQTETPIQIEVSAEGGLFQRVGQDTCRDIGVLTPDPASLNTPVPVNP